MFSKIQERDFLCRMAFETTEYGLMGFPKSYGFESYEEMYDFIQENVESISNSSNSENQQCKLLYDDIKQVNSDIDFFALDLSAAYYIAEHIVLNYRKQFSLCFGGDCNQ